MNVDLCIVPTLVFDPPTHGLTGGWDHTGNPLYSPAAHSHYFLIMMSKHVFENVKRTVDENDII